VAQLARDHLRIDTRATGAGFCSWLVATLQAEGLDGARDAVTVATFHAAKGLEWPVVHLAGLEDGFTPIGHARTTAERREEARLLHVAMTRAVTTLRCTWAAQRTFNGRTVERRVCPWLRDLAEAREPGEAVGAVGTMGGAAGRGDRGDRGGTGVAAPASPAWRERLAEQRALLAAARPTPAPALSALLAWREDAARAARVPPVAVLDDELLERVAIAHPTDREGLVAVPGMGRLLAERIGDGLLATLATVDGDDTPDGAGIRPG
jgi:DNA helicase II / ATP-dependent DNA helicase PcrA